MNSCYSSLQPLVNISFMGSCNLIPVLRLIIAPYAPCVISEKPNVICTQFYHFRVYLGSELCFHFTT